MGPHTVEVVAPAKFEGTFEISQHKTVVVPVVATQCYATLDVSLATREQRTRADGVPLEDGLFEARVLTADTLTGYRESALMLQFAEQDNVELRDRKVDPKRFDDPRHDETFEKHCLSRARASLRWLATEGALQISRPSGDIAEQAEVVLLSERCAVVPPPRFYPVTETGDAAMGAHFQRVSFCSTDGVERLSVHLHTVARSRGAEFQAWATRQSIYLYDDDPSNHAELSVTAKVVEISESRKDVLVRVEAPGQARVLLWWIDTDTPHPVYLALNTATAIPEDTLAIELEDVARSWRALPTKKPWWKPWG